MNTEFGPSKRKSSSISSLASAGAVASSSATSLFLPRSRQECSLRAKAEGAFLSTVAGTAFCDSLEEEEESSQSLSDSLNSDLINTGVRKQHSSESSDSFEDSIDDTANNTFDSDTCSFYSVDSRLTPHNNPSEVSLLDSKYYSEVTLYDSAQSLLTRTPSCQSSFWSVRSCETLDENDQDQLSYQTGTGSDCQRYVSGVYSDYTSCPDLSPTGIRKGRKLQFKPSWLDSLEASQALSYSDIDRQSLDACSLSALRSKSGSYSVMSAVDGSASPKVGEELETKKKKGLMSSFRKSRKTSRKLRQQKKAAADGDSTSTGTAVMSDGEQDPYVDSELSAPNSPAPVKNELLQDANTDIANSETNIDCHQATHERLNGTSSPKESSEPNSRNSSPLMGKNNKISETVKKFEEKEDKKVGKNKFGTSLFRKKKAEQPSTQQSSKDATDTTESETMENKSQPKTEPEQPSTDDSLPEGAADVPSSEVAGSVDAQSSSFRSYISSVQLVKNWTVNSDTPVAQLSPEALAKTSHDAADGGKAAVEGKAITPDKTSTTTIETKKVTTSSANSKPSATEVTSKKTTTVTIVSKQSPKPRSPTTFIGGRGKAPATPPSPSGPRINPKVSPGNTSPKTNSRQSKPPSPVGPKKLPSEFTASPSPGNTEQARSVLGTNSPRHQPIPPVTVTPSESYSKQSQSSYPTKPSINESSQVRKTVTNDMQQPPKIVINESPKPKIVIDEPQPSKKINIIEPSQPKGQVTQESQTSRETYPIEQPRTVSNTSQPQHKVTVSNPLQSKFSTMNQSQEPRQTKSAHEIEPQLKKEPAAEPLAPKRVPLRVNPGDAAVTPNPMPIPVSLSPGMVTPPSSPEGNSERDARETPEGDRTENEKNSLLDSTGLSDSWAGASTDKREHLYKILVIGELGTGKTSIIKRYVHQFFSQHYRATIGVDFALKVLNWDNNTVIRLQLWDIAGQERFGNMTRVYYKEAVGAFVVFDVTRAQTFDAVTKWKTDLDTKVTLADGSPIPTVLLANKCDQPKEGVVNNPARMDDYCRERGFSGWFETSAKENINIDEASRFLVNKILSNEKQGMMMTESLDTDKFSVDGKANPVDRSGCRC